MTICHFDNEIERNSHAFLLEPRAQRSSVRCLFVRFSALALQNLQNHPGVVKRNRSFVIYGTESQSLVLSRSRA